MPTNNFTFTFDYFCNMCIQYIMCLCNKTTSVRLLQPILHHNNRSSAYQLQYTFDRYLCVMFHYKARGLMCFCISTLPFSCICIPALCCCVSLRQSVTGKAGLSHKHSTVVDWINTARLRFPQDEYPMHVIVFPLLSHCVKIVGSPFVFIVYIFIAIKHQLTFMVY